MSKENENFNLLCICVLDLCGRICRDILLKFVPVQNCLGISHGLRLSGEQKRIVQNAATAGNYDEFDITLVYTFLRNGCRNIFPSPTAGWGTPPNGTSVSDDVERIRILRNTAYGHNHSASIHSQIYNIHITEITDICQRMDTVHNTNVTNTGVPYHQELQDILNNSTKGITIEYVEDMKKKIQIDIQTMEQNRDEQYEEIKQIIEDVGDEMMFIRRGMQNLNRNVNDLRVAFAVPSQKRDQALCLKERTSKALHYHDQSVYTKRKALEEFCLLKMNNSPNLCILVGEKGSGKSSTALAVIKSFSNSSFDKYLVHSTDELSVIRKTSSEKILVLIDDIDGASSDLHDKKRSIERYSKELKATYSCKNVTLLITAGCDVVTELQGLLNNMIKVIYDHPIVNLSDWPMTAEEKRETFNRYREVCCLTSSIDAQTLNRKPECLLSESEVEEIIQSEPPYGFPRACKMFFTDQTCLNLGIAFFRNAHYMLFEFIEGKCNSTDQNDKFIFVILCTVLFSKTVRYDEIIKFAAQLKMKKPCRMDVDRATTYLKGQHYIRENEKNGSLEMCTFQLFLAVLLVIGRNFPNVLFQFASRQILFEFVCSSSFEEMSNDLCCRIPEDQDEILAKKLLEFGNESLYHRTITNENFCVTFVREMFAKNGWFSTDLGPIEEESLKDVFTMACELTHLNSFLKVMIKHLVDKEGQFNTILKEGLFSCIYKGNVQKIAQFDIVSDDLRKSALIEAIKYKQLEIVQHYRSSLKNIFVKSFRISVEHSSPKIVEIIFKGFKITVEEILNCLCIAIDGSKADIVQVFEKIIQCEKMIGQEEKVLELYKRAVINHDIVNFKQLISIFFDLSIDQEKLFVHIVQCEFVGGLSFFSEIFGLSKISVETLSDTYIKATKNEDSTFFDKYCNVLEDSEIRDTVLFNALQSAIELQSRELVTTLLQKCPDHSEQFQRLLLTASAADDSEILKIMYERFDVKREETLYECLDHAICNRQFTNARFIHSVTDVSRESVQNIFLNCCQQDDPFFVKGTIELFGKEKIEDITAQTGMLLSLGSKEIHVLEFLLHEFDNKWLTDGTLQTVLAETCRCKPKSMEKLQSILKYAGKHAIYEETWEICIIESSKSGNTETLIHCLEMIGGNVKECTLMEMFRSCFRLPNLEAVNFLLRSSYSVKLQEKNKEEILLSVFQSKDDGLMSYVISTFNKDSFKGELAEKIFTLLTGHGNGHMFTKFIQFIGTETIPKQLVLKSFDQAISSNNAEIPTILAEYFKPEIENEALDRMLLCSLNLGNIANIQLLTGIPNLEFISPETKHRFMQIASERIDVLRILCNSLDVTKIPEATLIKALELSINECDITVFCCLLIDCEVKQLLSIKNELLLQLAIKGNKEAVECFLNKIGFDFDKENKRLAFQISSDGDFGNLLDYLLDEKVFGTSFVSHNTLVNAYRHAVQNNCTSSIEVLTRRFPPKRRRESLPAEQTADTEEQTKSEPAEDGIVNTVFSEFIQAAEETGNPNTAKVFGAVQDIWNVIRK